MRRFLVTGGAGFVGHHVCERLLQAGHAVVAYDDLNGFCDPMLKEKNILDLKALGKAFNHGQRVREGWSGTRTGSRRSEI